MEREERKNEPQALLSPSLPLSYSLLDTIKVIPQKREERKTTRDVKRGKKESKAPFIQLYTLQKLTMNSQTFYINISTPTVSPHILDISPSILLIYPAYPLFWHE